tara:strand:- start:342 stop:674 length:333 start_codon:yes stop_codon:yes gene_type:complete
MYGPVEVILTGVALFFICGVYIALSMDRKMKKRKKENDILFKNFIDEYNRMNREDFLREPTNNYGTRDNVIYHNFGTERDANLHEAEHSRLIYDPETDSFVKYWIKDTER